MFLLALLLTVVPVVAQSDVGRELVVNGDFETDANRDGWPDSYSGDRRVVKWLAEDGNHFIRMGGPTAVNASVGQIPSIQPDWFQLRVSIKVRAAEVVRGPESWHDARVAMAFFDAAKKQVGGWPSVMYWTGSTDGWQRFEKLFPIPPGATTLNITPALFNATGQVDYDDFSVVVTKLRPKLEDAVLPAGVVADWSLANAWRQETATRGKVCLNGLWKFLPLMQPSPTPARPADGQGWGYLKVPAVWPGRNVEAVKPIGPDIWEQNLDWAKVTEGWYEREVTVPVEWTGRRLFVSFDLPQTEATVYIGGQRLGAVRFPGGRLDLTDALRPGTTTRLAVHVTTDPLEKERMVAMREDLIERVKAEVRFRGLVGDVFLESEPTGPRLGAVQARPSVRQKALGLAVEAVDLAAGRRYRLEAVARREGSEEWRARSQPFGPGDLQDGRAVVSLPWANPRLWDFGQPNLYDLEVTLLEDGGKPLDSAATRFGFRELWLDGRNLMLNGSPVHLRAVNFSGGTSSDSALSATALRTTFSRLRGLGFNFIILSNYGLDPGQTTSFSELLEVADQEGFALAFSLPHALRAVGGGSSTDELYDRVARYAVDAAGNHPAVLAYAANHNSLGYHGDQNPAKMDGIHQHNPAGSRGDGFRRNRETAARREAFVRSLDPTRELYHHQSGHMGSWHTVNIYLNWSPIQERSEWLSHWADKGVKPLFFVEWGPPHQASWGGHRQGPFIWRNLVNSEPLGIEYGALVTGDRAYAPNPVMERYVDQYEQVYARRQPFHIHNVLGTLWASSNEHNNIELKTVYTDVVWPRLRTYGITAILPWDYGDVAWRKGQAPAELPQATDWSKLQRPGRAPDFLRTGGDYWTSAWPDWELTSWGRSFQRWNMPEAAYLAGAPERFTERGHNVAAGERLTKQAILINDTRESLTRPFTWRLTLGRGPVQEGRGTLSAPPGGVARAPISFTIPREATGELTLSLRVGSGDAQLDSMTLHVTPPARPTPGKLAVFDPVGLTTRELAAAKVTAQAVTAEASLDGFDALVIGREAIRLDNRLPDLAPLLGRGGRVLVMEQREEVLTQRLGFRTNDPSLRNVVVRVPEHPVLTDLDAARLADWRGESTLLPAAMELPEAELSDPPKDWLGFANTRVWKWGNAGQVATVVIEKPQRGDFTALLEGGFDLQYAPLLLHRSQGGEMLFCQMDVTARSAPDPAAQRLWANLLSWSAAAPARQPAAVRYLGGAEGEAVLRSLGVRYQTVTPPGACGPGLLVVGPEAGGQLAAVREPLAAAVRAGQTVIALNQTATSLQGWLPFEPVTKQEARTTSPLPSSPLTVGLGPGDLRWRGRRPTLLIGAPGVEPNVLSVVPAGRGAFVFCQTMPTDWDYADPYRVYLKPTYRRTAVMFSRLLANAGAAFETALPAHWNRPVTAGVDLSGEWQAVQDKDGRLTVGDLRDDLPWQTVKVPGTFDDQVEGWKSYDGVVWYRRVVNWTGPTDVPVWLRLGAIDDEDWTYVNGQPVGHVGQETHPDNYWSAPRLYRLEPGTLKPGANIIAIKVRDLRMSGGLVSVGNALRLTDRWLESYYLDEPAQLDDPYRYNRW